MKFLKFLEDVLRTIASDPRTEFRLLLIRIAVAVQNCCSADDCSTKKRRLQRDYKEAFEIHRSIIFKRKVLLGRMLSFCIFSTHLQKAPELTSFYSYLQDWVCWSAPPQRGFAQTLRMCQSRYFYCSALSIRAESETIQEVLKSLFWFGNMAQCKRLSAH